MNSPVQVDFSLIPKANAPVRVPSPWVKADKAERAANRAAKAWRPAHEPIVEDDCAHWFESERWEPEVILSFQSPGPTPAFGCWSPLALDEAIDAWLERRAAALLAPRFTPNTAPLVAAARKDEPVLLKVLPENDCLEPIKVVPSLVAKARATPKPEPEYWMPGVKKYAAGRIPIPTPQPGDLDVTIRRIDGFTGKELIPA